MGLPSNEDAFNRLQVLRFVVSHALSTPPRDILDDLMANWSELEQKRFEKESLQRSQEIVDIMKEAGLYEEASPEEREFLGTTMLTMDTRQQKNMSWRMECVAVLMWALGYIEEFPSIEEQSNPDLLKEIQPLSEEGGEATSLRSIDEIEKERALMELWNWRSRTRRLVETGVIGTEEHDKVVKDVTGSRYERGELEEKLKDDFKVMGVQFRDLPEEDWWTIGSIIQERHYALNWLCGYAPDNRWDDTPTDT